MIGCGGLESDLDSVFRLFLPKDVNSRFIAFLSQNPVTFCPFVGLLNMGLVMKKPIMKFKLTIVIFAIASLFFLQNDAVNANPLTDSIIINNFVFDSSGSPWLGDWVIAQDWQSDTNWKTDTALLFFRDSPPRSSAKWSLFLVPGPSVSTSLTNLSSGIYQLSCWAKSPTTLGWGGHAWLLNGSSQKEMGLLTFTDSTHRINDTSWIKYYLTDTLSLTSTDTVQIVLSGAEGQVVPLAKTLINNITFVKLLLSSGVYLLPGSTRPLTIYPNPVSHVATVSFSSEVSSPANVSIYNLLGSEVAQLYDGTLDSGNHSFTWDASRVMSGTYICVVRISGQVLHMPVVVTK